METDPATSQTITLVVDQRLIDAARERAREDKTSLDDALLEWLEAYASRSSKMDRYDKTVAALQGRFLAGRKFTREEMNGR